MQHFLRMVTAVVVVGFAALGSAHARSINYQHQRFPSGYAGTVYSQAPRELGRGIVGLACDMPSSICSNDERIND